MMMSRLLSVLVCVSALTSVAADEWDYVRRKWREDLSDPSTGLGAVALRTNLAERVAEWKTAMPWPVVKARAFAWLCEKTAIDVSEYDWFPTFARWTRHADKLHPFLPQMMKRKGEVMSARHPGLKDRWPYWCGYPDFDHSAPDWDDVLAVGFTGMAERLRKNWKDTDYYPPRKIAVDAVFRLIDRLIAQGEMRLKGLADGSIRLAKQVDSLKRLRAGPPVATLDALNLIYLYWVMSENFEGIQVRTLGNLDRLLTPFYRADLAAGRTTEAEFRDQLKHFWWQWGSMANYWGQPVYFGGTKADGTTEYNEVSAILLDVHDQLALPTPKLHVKVGKSTPDWVWNRTIDMARRMRPISFLGEESHARVMRSMGYTAEQARTFLVWGCYEWAVRDSANDTFGAAVNLLKPVEEMMAEAASGRLAAPDFDAFKDTYLERIAGHVDAACAFAREDETEMAEINPSLLFSLATPYSVEVGKDAYSGGMKNGNNTGIWLIGIGSAVDALSAVREFVYDQKSVTLAEFGKTLAADWIDADDLCRRVRRSKCKWGNNDPVANAIAAELTDCLAGRINGQPNGRGGRFKAFGHTARWHYIFGKAMGATPDGRKAGEELSKNVSPTMGADTEGATALVASAASIDALKLPGDYPLDVALLPATASGEKGLLLMRSLIDAYFGNGGMVIQFNVHDADTLRDAQRHPEKYENLQVRVAGWNVRWNDIPKAEQDKFILRTERISK